MCRSALAGDQLRSGAYSNDAVVSHLAEQFPIVRRTRITHTDPITEAQAKDFLIMTPLTFGVRPNTLDAGALKQITIDADVLIAALSE